MSKHSGAKAFLHKWLPISLLYLSPLLLFIYTALRAHHLSLTHDECGSFAIWTNYDIFTCRTNPDCWGTANLHWLYVLLMKISVGLFGDSELAIRLPALLGHLVYLFFSFKLVKWVVDSLNPSSYLNPHAPYLSLFGFLLLNVNPYLLEFHSLARGYGLAMGMMMMSLYFLARWVEGGRLGAVACTLLGAFLAVMSNFTLLIYFACLLAVIGGMMLLAFFKKDENKVQRAKWAVAGSLAFVGLLAWLLANPIKMLRERGEFEWGVESFYQTYKSLVHCSLYGGRYLKMYNLEFFGGLFFVLLLAALLLALRPPSTVSRSPSLTRFYLAAVSLPLLAAAAAVAQHWILGTNYQVDRTAIMFIPLCALVVFLFFAHLLAQKSSGWRVALAVLVGLFCVVHFGRVAQLRYTSEWGYDAETKNMISYLAAKGTKINLGVNWLYHPSATYYLKRRGDDFTQLPVYSKTLRTDGFYDYYYVQPEDVPALDSFYVEEKRFSWVGVLLRKK